MQDTLSCPQCGEQITITQALKSSLEQEAQQKYAKKITQIKQEFQKKQTKLEQQQSNLEKQEEEMKHTLAKKLAKERETLKQDLWEKAQKAAKSKQQIEIKDLEQQLKEKQKQEDVYIKQELELRKQKRDLAQKQKELELTLEKKLEDARGQLVEKVEKEYQERMRLKLLEKEKQLKDTQKALEEARRKADQGSQQNQGEVLELDLEQVLQEAFVHDSIEPVGKGVSGADVIQTVKNMHGRSCGVLLWESKHTKRWSDTWIDKLKSDLRAKKANIPIIVSAALPDEIKGFGMYQGVWVVQRSLAVQLATALRKNLLVAAYERVAAQGKGEKQELLYNYVSSHEFRQRVEAIVEVYVEMQQQIEKEQAAYARMWKRRSMQLKRLFVNTAGMYGEMQGLVGTALPEIKGLELDSISEGDGVEEGELKLF